MNKAQVTSVKQLLDQDPRWFEEAGRMDLAQMSSRNYPYAKLFSPIQVNHLTLKNRIMMGPMGNISMAEEFGHPTNKMIQYFADRARRASLIASGLVPCRRELTLPSQSVPTSPASSRIDSSRTVFSGWH